MYYEGTGPDAAIVEEGQAYGYALERCLHGTLQEQKEFRGMLVEWYYSGGEWIRRDDDERDHERYGTCSEDDAD